MNTPTDPLEEQITDIITETLDFYYGKETKHQIWRPHGIAVNKILALIHTREQQARVDQMRQDMKFMNSQIGLNVDVDKFVDEQLATFNKEETNE